MATRVAAWVLALFAAGHLFLLSILLTSIGKPALWPVVFILPALAAFVAAWRITSILDHGARWSDVLVALCLGWAALFFGVVFYSEGAQMLKDRARLTQDEALVLLATFLPAVLSTWVAGAILWSKLRPVIKGRSR